MLEQNMQAFAGIPPAAVSRILGTFDRRQLAGFIEVAIGLLDVASGDPDLEDDDPSGQCDEDELNTDLHQQYGRGPGCSISDAGEDEDRDTGNAEDEHLSNARWLADEDAWTCLDRIIPGGGSDGQRHDN